MGKFLSGDPYVSDPYNGQNYNRYSYVLNNPTNLTDPTGYAWTDFIPVYGSAESFGEEIGEGHWAMAAAYGGMAIEEGLSLGAGAIVKGAIKSAIEAEVKHEAVTQIAKEGSEQAAHAAEKASEEASAHIERAQAKAEEQSATSAEENGTASGRVDAKNNGGRKRDPKFKDDVWEQNRAKNDGSPKCDKCDKDVVPGTKLEKGEKVPGNRGEADHKDRLADGGADKADKNGQLLCHDCHVEKTRMENSKPKPDPNPPPPEPKEPTK